MYLQSCLKSILLSDFDIHGLFSVLKSIDIHVEIKTITLNVCTKYKTVLISAAFVIKCLILNRSIGCKFEV